MQNCECCSGNNSSWLNVGYIQYGATQSVMEITDSGIQCLDIVVLAFADSTKAEMESHLVEAIKKIVDKEKSGTINLLSIGGLTVAEIPDTEKAVSNICSQIDQCNAQLKNGEISGVDLDLENWIPEKVITDLARGFKKAGYTVSAAPQVYTSGGDISSANPSNLVLTSGGTINTYAQAIEAEYFDYIFVQAYNSDGFAIDGVKENSVSFFLTVAKALNNYADELGKIPKNTKIMIGEPANQGAAGKCAIFNPTMQDPVVEYNQEVILNKIKDVIFYIHDNPASFTRINGVMMWSSNNDYMPNAPDWKDKYAVPGGFSQYIFGAAPKK